MNLLHFKRETESGITGCCPQSIKRMHKKKLATDGVGWIDPKSNNRVVTVHGFRSTFRDWAGETTAYPREVCEHALAHGLPDKVEAAYQRGDLFMKRKGLMNAWARYLDDALHT